MKEIKVGLLHWTVSGIEEGKLLGAGVLEDLNNRPNVHATFFAKKVVGDIPNTRTIRHINFLIKYDFFYYLQFLRWNRDSNILHGLNTPLLAIFAPRRTIIHFHNVPFLPLHKVFKNRYQKSHFAFCSRFLYQKFIEKYPFIPLRNCFVLHNAVDTKKFTPRQAVCSKVRIDQKKRIFFMGQWSEEKGFYFLLEVIKGLEKKRGDFEVYLAGSPHFWGSGEGKRGRGEDAISDLLSQLKSVHALGIVKHADIPRTLREMDILVVPSLWQEPFGLVNLEGMAAGLPIVACKVGGIPEIVEHGREGFLVEPGNVHEMVKYIEILLDDDEMRIRMGKSGRGKVEQHFSWDMYMRKLLEIYGSILSEK